MTQPVAHVGKIGRIVTVALVVVTLAGCTKGRNGPSADTKPKSGPHTLKKLSVAERQAVMERAKVWRPLNTSSLDLIKGPVLPERLRIPSQVSCAFFFPPKPVSGDTAKFLCELPKEDIVKVKYGEKNGEVYAEVAGTRLLWALGFQADVMYPSKVTCLGCPDDPFAVSGIDWQRGSPTSVSTKVFDPAVVERAGGSSVETPGFEGWAWPELDKLGKRPGAATRAQLDALKLLAVFIQHSDSKPDQQQIVCEDGAKHKESNGSETCDSAWLVIKDLGVTFGKSTRLNTSKMNLADWKSVPVWKDANQCVGDLPRSLTGSLENPVIGEAGRRFLAERLMQLRDRQLRDLFDASQVMKRGETIEINGQKRPVTIDDWVSAFKKKRNEVVTAHCAVEQLTTKGTKG